MKLLAKFDVRPRCRYHVGQEMRLVMIDGFKEIPLNLRDSEAHRRKKRLAWKCPVADCPYVAAAMSESDLEEAA